MAHNNSVQQAEPVKDGLAAGPDIAIRDDELTGSDVIAQDLLVEEVSIDGMCGVY